MGAFFHTFVYQPLYNILVLLYNVIPGADFGIAIIAITVFLRLILIPLYKKQIESQRKLQELQPKIKELQKKTKNDKEKQAREMMELYKEHKTNPFSGCLPLIIQLIFLIAIYRILMNISDAGLTIDSSQLYSFINNPGKVNQFFISIVDLTKPSVVIASLAAIAQFFQTKMLMSKTIEDKNKSSDQDSNQPDMAQMMSKQMLYLGPILTIVIGIKFAAGLSLYWLTSTLFMLIQQVYIQKKDTDSTKN